MGESSLCAGNGITSTGETLRHCATSATSSPEQNGRAVVGRFLKQAIILAMSVRKIVHFGAADTRYVRRARRRAPRHWLAQFTVSSKVPVVFTQLAGSGG